MSFTVKFQMNCTMIDGKVCHVLSGEKASNRCNICGVGPSKVNDFSMVLNLPCKKENNKFGLSTMHMRIRFLEYVLHIA